MVTFSLLFTSVFLSVFLSKESFCFSFFEVNITTSSLGNITFRRSVPSLFVVAITLPPLFPTNSAPLGIPVELPKPC